MLAPAPVVLLREPRCRLQDILGHRIGCQLVAKTLDISA